MRDFTLNCYSELCNHLLKNYKPVTVSDYIINKDDNCHRVIVRHDVDRNVNNAVNMAKIEKELGIRSTYYFRYPKTFDIRAMNVIFQMGHEIGYHYECLSKTKNNLNAGIILFNKELEIFRKNGFEVSSVCPHGGSLFYSNHDLLSNINFSNYGIVGEAYSTLLNDNSLFYLSDTGRTWGAAPYKKISVFEDMKIKTTKDLITFINGYQSDLYILIHPDRWANNIIGYYKSLSSDILINNYKKVSNYFNL